MRGVCPQLVVVGTADTSFCLLLSAQCGGWCGVSLIRGDREVWGIRIGWAHLTCTCEVRGRDRRLGVGAPQACWGGGWALQSATQ